jgi:hypothetical protein
MDKNQQLIRLCETGRFWTIGFDQLSYAEQVFRAVWELEEQVNNGGFDQYFWNSSGDSAHAVVGALESIGATNAAQIVAAACGLFRGGSPPRVRAEREARIDALTDVERAALDDFDQQFYCYPDDLTALLHEFVTRNAKEITGAAELGFQL